MRINPLVFIVGCLFLLTCQKQSKERIISLPEGREILFLSEDQAQIEIAKDEVEGFFEKITFTDIAIQSSKAVDPAKGRNNIIEEYKMSLRQSVLPFTPEDKSFLEPILKEIGRLALKINPDLLPEQLNLIKFDGSVYGENVFFTRANNIIIPRLVLNQRSQSVMQSILLHELFHIYSRYHPEKKEALYEVIGFKPLGIEEKDLKMPEELRSSLLLNPDGVSHLYAINLMDNEGQTHQCIPLTSSIFHQFSMNEIDYFPHMSVNYYPVKKLDDGTYELQTKEDGSSPLAFSEVVESLFQQLGKNTFYVIHPDEVVADNFSILALGLYEEEAKNEEMENNLRVLRSLESILKDGD